MIVFFAYAITDLFAIVMGGSVAIALAWANVRNRTGGFWKATAEEAKDRINVVEKQNHELLAENAKLKAQPNLDALYELMRHHDERMNAVAASIQEQAQQTALLLGAIGKTLEDLNRKLNT